LVCPTLASLESPSFDSFFGIVLLTQVISCLRTIFNWRKGFGEIMLEDKSRASTQNDLF
jgi:hypothetical protein